MKKLSTILCSLFTVAISSSATLAESNTQMLSEAVTVIAGASACGQKVSKEVDHVYNWIGFTFDDHDSVRTGYLAELRSKRDEFRNSNTDCNAVLAGFRAFDVSRYSRSADVPGFAEPPREYADGAEWQQVGGLREDRRGYFSAMCSMGAREFGDSYSQAHYNDKQSKPTPYLEIHNSGSRYFIRDKDGSSRVIEFTLERDLVIVGQWFANGEPFPGKYGRVIPRCPASEVVAYDPDALRKNYFGKVQSMSELHCDVLASQVSAIAEYRRSGAPIEAAYSFGDVAGSTDIRLRKFMYATVQMIYEGNDLSKAVADGRWTKACAKAIDG